MRGGAVCIEMDGLVAEGVARVEQVQPKQREVGKTVAQLERDRQITRKVEINAELRKLKAELEGIKQ